MEGLASIFFLATFIEGLVQYLFATEGVSKPYLKYVALAFGVGLAIAYKIDIPSMLGIVTSYGYVNYAISGIIIGRGSNYVNDILKSFKK